MQDFLFLNTFSFGNLQIFHPFLFVLFVGAATGGPTSHLSLGGHHNPTPHPALSTPHQFGSSVTSNGGPGSTGEREPVVDDKKHLSGKRFLPFFLAILAIFWRFSMIFDYWPVVVDKKHFSGRRFDDFFSPLFNTRYT